MPKLLSKIEGRGNGIKTVVPNIADVAKALARPASYPTKFFGFELGSQSTIDIKNDKYIVNGAHDIERLKQLLDVFIFKFVLCPSCMNPETELVITKNDEIIRDCKACGANKPVDMRHKLVAYILKNPPEVKKSKKGAKKPTESNTPEEASDHGEENNGDDELTRRINDEVAQLGDASHIDHDDWAEDTSPEAVAARLKELQVSGAVDKLLDDGDDLQDPLEVFADYVTSNPTSHVEIFRKAQDMELRHDKCAAVLAQILFDANINAKSIQDSAPLLQKFLTNEKNKIAFLGGIERFVGQTHKELLPKIAMILKFIYDADLIEEEVFLVWGEKVSKKYVEKAVSKEIRSKAEPFLNWLRDAESEESE